MYAELFSNFKLWLGENFGNTLSVIGLATTIYFSWGARDAAKAARVSADRARSRLAQVDLIADLNKVSSSLQELRVRVEHSSLEMISEKALFVRSTLSPLIEVADRGISEQTREKLSEMLVQMKVIGEAANKMRASGQKFPSTSKTVSILDDQVEAVSKAIQEVKTSLGGQEHD